MAEYPGALPLSPLNVRAETLGGAPPAYYHATQLRPALKVFDGISDTLAGAATDAASDPGETAVGFLGVIGTSSTPGLDFYERFHVVPRVLDFGNVLSTTTTPIEVFSAFRDRSEFWLGFDNNAGAGVDLLGEPALPVLVRPMAGFILSVQVTLDGPAVVDSTLDFEFSTGEVSVPISLRRILLFPIPAESGFDEELEWETDVILHTDDSEQRISCRKNPRQFFSWEVFADDGAERSSLENLLFDWQSRLFGIPIFTEDTVLTAAVTAAVTTTIQVASTENADYRDGGLIVIYDNRSKFDVLNLVSHTSTTLVVENPPANSYALTDRLVVVAPLRLAALTAAPRGARYRTGLERLKLRFRVTDNDANLADTSAYPTFNSKVLLDDANFVDGTMEEEFTRTIVRLDGDVGLVSEWSRPDRHRRRSAKRFVCGTRAHRWQVRRLLHALRGRQVSLYLPTFCSDLVPTGTMASGASTLAVANVGYTAFVRTRQPKNVIRVVPVSGAAFLRTIIGSTAPDATTENITISGTWPSTLTPSQILRIEFVEKVRQASDSIRIQHRPGGSAVIDDPMVAVLE